MAEPTLLQQARKVLDRTGDVHPGNVIDPLQFNALCRTVERMLQHLEQREADGRHLVTFNGPKCKVCGLAEAYNVHGGSLSGHRFVPLDDGAAAQVPGVAGPKDHPRGTVSVEPKCKVCGKTEFEWGHNAVLDDDHHPWTPALGDALDLDALQRLCDAATPGPWMRAQLLLETDGETLVCRLEDVAFIAAARDALPKLIAKVKELERPVKR